MKATRKEIVQGVLTDFLGMDSDLNPEYEEGFIALVLDEDEIEILSTAIDEVLEKGKQ